MGATYKRNKKFKEIQDKPLFLVETRQASMQAKGVDGY